MIRGHSWIPKPPPSAGGVKAQEEVGPRRSAPAHLAGVAWRQTAKQCGALVPALDFVCVHFIYLSSLSRPDTQRGHLERILIIAQRFVLSRSKRAEGEPETPVLHHHGLWDLLQYSSKYFTFVDRRNTCSTPCPVGGARELQMGGDSTHGYTFAVQIRFKQQDRVLTLIAHM